MRTTLAIAALAAALGAAAGAARADTPAVLTGDVGAGDAFVIALVDASGAKVSHLDPGTYTLVVHDHSALHNFHLSGPGVDVQTDVDATGDRTFTVTLADGIYVFECDPHSSRMKGSFTVGTVAVPPSPVRLAASLSASSASRLGPLAGLASGAVVVTVRDRSTKDGFRLAGPGVVRSTGARFTGVVTWTVTLRPGTYTYGSAKTPARRRVFIVSGP